MVDASPMREEFERKWEKMRKNDTSSRPLEKPGGKIERNG